MHGAVLTGSDFKAQLVENKKQELAELGRQLAEAERKELLKSCNYQRKKKGR